jgi:hypothetical protein
MPVILRVIVEAAVWVEMVHCLSGRIPRQLRSAGSCCHGSAVQPGLQRYLPPFAPTRLIGRADID